MYFRRIISPARLAKIKIRSAQRNFEVSVSRGRDRGSDFVVCLERPAEISASLSL